MKFYVAILLLFTLLKTGFADLDAFYIWQQIDSPLLQKSITNESPTTCFYSLASVVPAHGKSKIHTLKLDQHNSVPVIRIPLSAFKRSDLLSELNRLTQTLHPSHEIQFDLDCPERLLERYLDLVTAYRQVHPNLRLSITALPAHLKHKTFRKLAEVVDEYILQVHGIDVPKKWNDPAELLNIKRAKKALRQAEGIGRPYRVALPCYAYELNFNPTTENFLFLTAEKPSRRTDTLKKRIIANPRDLIELQQLIKTLPNCHGIIWFRLPIKGDRLCLPRASLTQIQKSEVPTDTVQCLIKPINDHTLELELHNKNTIHACRATLKINWSHPRGAFDLYQNVQASNSIPGQLPTTLSVPMPPPGDVLKIGWFHATTNPPPQIEITLQ